MEVKRGKDKRLKVFYSLFLSETESRIGTKNKYRVTDAKIKMNLGGFAIYKYSILSYGVANTNSSK